MQRRVIMASAVPTEWAEIKWMLRQLQEPIILFGERIEERRERLKIVLEELQTAGEMTVLERLYQGLDSITTSKTDDEFYTEGPPELLTFRQSLVSFSLARAHQRAMNERAFIKETAHGPPQRPDWPLSLQTDTCVPGSAVFMGLDWSPDGGVVAGSLAGEYTVFNPDLTVAQSWTPAGEGGRVTCVNTRTGIPGVSMLSGDASGGLTVWRGLGPGESARLTHPGPVNRLAVHPHGATVATSTGAGTWHLWDVEQGVELSGTRAHQDQVLGLSVHPDGSLLATASLDSTVALWDLRTGHRALILAQHAAGAVDVAWNPDGWRLASGGQDGRALVWDVRRGVVAEEILAHQSVVTKVAWCQGALVTAGHDGMVWFRDAYTYETIRHVRLPGRLMGLAFSEYGVAVARPRVVSVLRCT